MSLSAALKAGLKLQDLNDAPEAGDWDPYPESQPTTDNSLMTVQSPKKAPSNDQPSTVKSAANRNAEPVARPPRQATPKQAPSASRQASRRLAEPAKRARKGSGKATDAAVRSVTPQQYIRELDWYRADQYRRLTGDTVIEVSSDELQSIARMAAKVRARYMAKLLDCGGQGNTAMKVSELEELSRYRQMHDELRYGLDMLRRAIEEGDVSVSGTLHR